MFGKVFFILYKGVIILTVNGEDLQIKDNISLYDFLKQQGYDTLKIAVELNGDIVPKNQYKDIILKNEYAMEVVSFVGGGW